MDGDGVAGTPDRAGGGALFMPFLIQRELPINAMLFSATPPVYSG